jgi:RNA polymerase sigma-70 factor (ECF subfamily)
LKDHPDISLLKGCIEGDRRAQHQLYQESYDFLYHITRRYTVNKDDAMDFLNQSFLKNITNQDKFRAGESFRAWTSSIAIRTCIDEIRKSKRYHEHVDTRDSEKLVMLEKNNAETNTASEKMQAEDLLKLVRELPDVTREVFNMHALDGFSHKEVCDILGITETASRWHVHRARQILKEKIAVTRLIKVA